MGERGPVPKASAERRRRNKAEPVQKVESGGAARQPATPRDWHPVAKRWFDSLKRSAQAVFYEPSDWATAFLVAESMSRELKPQVVGVTEEGEPVWASLPPKGASLAAWLKAMTALLVTEGDRRRMRMEVQQPESKPEGVSHLDDYRRRFAEDV